MLISKSVDTGVQRARGIEMLRAGLPNAAVVKILGVTGVTARRWRRHAFRQERRNLFDAVDAVARRKEATFVTMVSGGLFVVGGAA